MSTGTGKKITIFKKSKKRKKEKREKRLILGLEQGMNELCLGNLVGPESKEDIKD